MGDVVSFDFESVPASRLREEEFRDLPHRPSVFRIFDRNGNLILLEKTHSLPRRLERFYSESPQPGAVDLRRISDRVEYCTTDSPFESLYLLYLERRRWFPSSYRRMKTFPRYHLLQVDTRQRFPRITSGRVIRDQARCLGPFRSRTEVERIRTLAERAFRLRPCEYDIRGDDPYPDCLYFQMETCSRPCNGDIDRIAYAGDVDSAIQLILGREDPALSGMLARIQSLAEETRFEEAEQLRVQMERIRSGGARTPHPVFEVGCFDFAVLLNARSRRRRKVAVVRGGRILGLEEHAVDSLEEGLAASFAAWLRRPADEVTESQTYDEFCLCSRFLLRPLANVVFFPLREPGTTATAITRHVQQTAAKSGVRTPRNVPFGTPSG